MQEDILICQCGSPAHQMILGYDDTDDMNTVYVAIHLAPHHSFLTRLWRAIKYVFSNTRCDYGDFEEVILRPQDADKLIKAANFLKNKKEDINPIIYPVNQIKESLPS
jgi:hypothetical protein